MKPTEDPRQFDFESLHRSDARLQSNLEDNELDEAEARYEKVNKELDKSKC